MTDLLDAEPSSVLSACRVAFIGKLGGVTRRHAQQIVRDHGGSPVESTDEADLIVIGADELPLPDEDALLSPSQREAAAQGRLEIITETQLWERLGLVEGDSGVRRLYTPAMLAELLGVPLAVIRRWHRRGLIVPAREVHRLPYFDFHEVATARRLAELLAAGASPDAIEKKLERLSRYLPDVERPLAQLSVIVEGRQLLLRQGEGLIEPGGQLRFDFEASNLPAEPDDADAPPPFGDANDFLAMAARLEDQGELHGAIQMCRAALAAGASLSEVSFQLAELLYRIGEVAAARERYYMAIELDEDYVEARANLGCVLAETGELELAAAAFEGALARHDEYPDAHYHLARTFEELGEDGRAREHWERFLELAPDSPWAVEASMRLEEMSGEEANR